MILPQGKVKHLMYRAGFGTGLGVEPWDMKSMWKASAMSTPLAIAEKPVLPDRGSSETSPGQDQKEKAKQMFEKSRQDLMKVNVAWVLQMHRQPGLRERMTFFWHNHFACRTLFPWFAQDLNNQIRSLALESFSDLLMTVSKHPAMLQFLNNQQNRKDHPNENFAREVMELFTLGRGNYTEDDIREAARAFTGWGFNAQGDFQFRPRQHDEASKTFRGKTGNFQGEDIIHMILEDRQTAVYITRKLAATLVSDDDLPDNVIKDWADTFYRSGYRTDKLIDRILQSDEFAKPANQGTRIKSPIELLVGMLLHTNGKFEDEKSLVFFQRALGQILFFPPNVSGWPRGKAWIDSSSLTFRTTLPRLLFSGDETDFRIKEDGDVNGLQRDTTGRRRLHCQVDWASLAHLLTKSNKSDTLDAIEDFLLARPVLSSNKKWLEQVTYKASDDQELVKNAFISMMSLPEYQMC